MKRALVLTLALCAVFAGGSQAAEPAATSTIVVDADGHGTAKNCDSPALAYSTIQAAVDFASPNTTIKVCPATYPEQVTINKNGIQLVSIEDKGAIIQAPASMTSPDAIVRVTGGAQSVSIKKFTITGPLPDAIFCGDQGWGVRIDGGAQASITSNHITEIRSTSTSLRGCQQGDAVMVGRDSEGQFGFGTITGNTIDNYQKTGLLIDGAGTVATVSGNTVLGNADDGTINAQNGIQVSRSAVGKVKSNSVSENIYTGDTGFNATGILVYLANSDSSFSTNTPNHNDDNLSLYGTLSVLVKGNTSTNAVVYDGLFADSDSRNNKFTSNTASGNFEFDCDDFSTGGKTAGTANTWTNNTGATANPAGICTAPAESAAPGARPLAVPHPSPAS